MYAQASQKRSVSATLHAAMEYCLSKLISRHGKRILFITSLYFQVVQIERLKADAISKLNSIMHLAHSEEALKLPAAIRSIVWNKADIARELTVDQLDGDISEEKAKEISAKVVAMAPSWIRYGRTDDMIKDVVDLICNGHQIAETA